MDKEMFGNGIVFGALVPLIFWFGFAINTVSIPNVSIKPGYTFEHQDKKYKLVLVEKREWIGLESSDCIIVKEKEDK